MKRTSVFSSLLTIGATLVLIYLITGLLLFLLQDKILFLPSGDIRTSPASAGMTYEEHFFPSHNGNQIHGWFVPAASNENALTILFCHGNAGNISGRVSLISLYHSLGYNVFIFDYQGYGLSEGSPSETNILEDGLAAWDFLTHELGVPSHSVLPVGRSMGGAVAAHIAAQRNPRALAIESTFTSVPDMAKQTYYIYPIDLMARIQLPTIEFVRNFDGPVMIAHSREDRLIPYEMGRKLYEVAGPQRFWLELSGDHNEGYIATGKAYGEAYKKFVKSHFADLLPGEY